MAQLEEGDNAPAFTGSDQNGNSISLSEWSMGNKENVREGI